MIEPRLMTGAEAAVANPSELANDTLRGAEEIAEFLYGDRTQRRKVYHNASPASVNPLPTFRDGNLICARKSTILEWIKAQEVQHGRHPRTGPRDG